jgi:hypothetical protein
MRNQRDFSHWDLRTTFASTLKERGEENRGEDKLLGNQHILRWSDDLFLLQVIQKQPQTGPKAPSIVKKREKVIHGGGQEEMDQIRRQK